MTKFNQNRTIGRLNPKNYVHRCFWVILFLLCLSSNSLFASSDIPDPLDSIPLERPSDDRLILEPPVRIAPPPVIDLPPFDSTPSENPSIKDLLNFVARKFRFEGNTIFSDQELAALIDNFRMTPINALDLEELRLLITKHYTDRGYINSGALFPDQNLLGGLLIIEITEGVLQQIQIENSGRLSLKYIEERLKFRADEPLRLDRLQAKLHLLQKNPRIERLNAVLQPGPILGTSILDIRVTEAKPYAVNFEINNHRPPSIGKTQTILSVKHLNLSGSGDSINFSLNNTKYSKSGRLRYDYPITNFETNAYIGASNNDIRLSGTSGITSRGYSVRAGIKSPLIRRKNEKYDIDLKFEYKSNISSVNSACGKLSDNSPINISAMRLGQSLVKKYSSDVIYFRHTMSLGVNAFNTTVCSDPHEADSRFTSWLLQMLWSHKFKLYKIQTIVRGSLQTSQRPLLSAEKFTIGGANTIRGVTENALVRDNGRFYSIEARLPLRTRTFPKLEMQAIVFSDYGAAWNANYRERGTISSIGAGYRWRFKSIYLAELFAAKVIRDRSTPGNSLQGQRFHARIKIELY